MAKLSAHKMEYLRTEQIQTQLEARSDLSEHGIEYGKLETRRKVSYRSDGHILSNRSYRKAPARYQYPFDANKTGKWESAGWKLYKRLKLEGGTRKTIDMQMRSMWFAAGVFLRAQAVKDEIRVTHISLSTEHAAQYRAIACMIRALGE